MATTLQCSPLFKFAYGVITFILRNMAASLCLKVVKLHIYLFFVHVYKRSIREVICNPPFSLLVSAVVVHAAATRGRRIIIYCCSASVLTRGRALQPGTDRFPKRDPGPSVGTFGYWFVLMLFWGLFFLMT